jgi:hypothetical protein
MRCSLPARMRCAPPLSPHVMLVHDGPPRAAGAVVLADLALLLPAPLPATCRKRCERRARGRASWWPAGVSWGRAALRATTQRAACTFVASRERVVFAAHARRQKHGERSADDESRGPPPSCELAPCARRPACQRPRARVHASVAASSKAAGLGGGGGRALCFVSSLPAEGRRIHLPCRPLCALAAHHKKNA